MSAKKPALSAMDRVRLARHPDRPGAKAYVNALFTDFFEQKGDRLCREDPSIFGGIARYKGRPVTVLGYRRGANLEERLRCHFGMPGPEGYRKAQRLVLQAEKFRRPVITFVDTPGAYPGIEAEERGQAEAIARTLMVMSGLTVPVISILIGEGGSGGALALAMGNRVLMLENAVYSVLSPEGFASILWRDASRAKEACEVMKLTAADLAALGAADVIVPEPPQGAHTDPEALWRALDEVLARELAREEKQADPARRRRRKFAAMGGGFVRKEEP